MKSVSLMLIAAVTLAACAKDDLAAKSNEAPTVASAVNVAASTATGPTIKVYKDPNCGCCNNWVDHLRQNGFVVETMDMPDLSLLKQRYMIGEQMQSCHTAVVGDYAIEGHVPADLILKLLKEKPAVAGLAVPGMPQGSPGMEGAIKERYDVLTFDRAGKTTVYAQR
jgi:hypothetical protein